MFEVRLLWWKLKIISHTPILYSKRVQFLVEHFIFSGSFGFLTWFLLKKKQFFIQITNWPLHVSVAYSKLLITERTESDELKSLLMKMKEESEKAGLKLNIQKTKIMASGPIISWQIDGETMETVRDFILGGSKITADYDCSHEIKRYLLLGRKAMTNLDSILKSRDSTLETGPSSQSYGFSSSHVRMWELDSKESWVPKNWCFWIMVLEKTLESPLDCKEIQLVHPKGSQSWIFIGRTDADAETPILWPPDAKN